MPITTPRAGARGRIGAAISMLAVAAAVAVAAPLEGAGEQKALEAAINAVKPALVKIDLVDVEYADGRERKSEASGSGVIISAEGLVVTNHHVAGNAKRLVCTLANKERIEAELVGTDPLADIAVIKLKPDKPRTFPGAKFGDSSSLKPGDRVLAMGSPLAFSQSVTTGIVANNQLVMPREDPWYRITLEGENVGSIVAWIAHDAAIYGGNSGGPLVNMQGEIVGINELRMGLSAAIPSNLVKEVTAQLIQHGEVVRSWIGLEVQPQLEGRSSPQGVLVSGAVPDSPAEKAGFHSGDLLIRYAGQDISVHFREELVAFNRLVFDAPVGTKVEAVVLRDGQPVTLTVTTEKRERVRPKEAELKEWGVCARDLSLMAVKEMGLERRDGALVTSVRPGGPCDAARPAIVAQDVIVRVGDTAIKNVHDLIETTTRITAGQAAPVATLVWYVRSDERYLTVVKVGREEFADPGREVRKAWLPVASQVLTRDIAQALAIPNRTGVVVTRVYPRSTAEKAGLEVGDILVALNGDPILAAEPGDVEVLPAMVRQLRVGASAELTVLREGKEQKVSVELVAAPPLPREMKRYRDEHFEFTGRDVTFFDRAEQRWVRDQPGVMVQEVGEGGWAALGNLAADDLIVAVDDAPATDVSELERIMKDLAERQPSSVVFHVIRGIHHLYIEMRPAWRSAEPRT